jgi:hypothetical protein
MLQRLMVSVATAICATVALGTAETLAQSANAVAQTPKAAHQATVDGHAMIGPLASSRRTPDSREWDVLHGHG